ncbi:MAG: hypothetical protein HOD92_26925 [Deltaproteobacteria bacterium]|nr:hypothetical protein [Deltaproteobacteria bacterium]
MKLSAKLLSFDKHFSHVPGIISLMQFNDD